MAWLSLSCGNGKSPDESARQLSLPIEIQGRSASILDDDGNRRYWGESSDTVPSRVRVWLEALRRIGMQPATIRSLEDWQGDLLVLPHSYCLSNTDVSTIHNGIADGRGVLYVGPVGVRDSGGGWLGWNRFHSIVGSTDLREYSGLETMFLVVSGKGPVGSIPRAGHRISFLRREGQWGVAGLPGAAYWADYDRKGYPVDREFHASAIGARGAGRFVWVGFDPGLAADVDHNERVFDQLLADLVVWSLSEPEVEVDLYPGGSSNALMFVMDTEWQFQNAEYLGDLLQSHGIRGGFMCVNEFAEQHPALVRELAKHHDIGSHSEDHSVFAGQPRHVQTARLCSSAAVLAELSGQSIVGFRPPEELYDDATLDALAETGFSYLLGGEASSIGLPSIIQHSEDQDSSALVIIPRIQRDDLYLANSEQLSVAEMSGGWLRDWETVRRHRGIHYVSLHSTWITGPQQVATLDSFLDGISLDDVWVPGPNELAEWWLKRSNTRAEVMDTENHGKVLALHNAGTGVIRDVGVWASLPGNPRTISVLDERVLVRGPDDRGAFLFLVEEIPPGRTLRIPIESAGSAH